MPIVNVKVLAGAFTHAQREQMIDGITDAMVSVGGEGMRPNIQVLVEEVPNGLWGIGGVKLTTEAIEARRKARAEGG